ncbi:MAG TPA: glycosyltransferase family 2 protein [Anaerolineae bacterium]|jgi:glycosyltransferase involved in cell wall biosynthesis|nr:glycosyltransferase family 2 protein [Anaerolineae bacterium]
MMKLSVLIPVYNEEATLAEVVRRVAEVGLEMEIIVVDDCSTDGTPEVLSSLKQEGLVVLTHDVNRGKGAAIRTALAAASGDAVIIQDADLEYDPADFPRLVAPFVEGRASVVYGVRSLSEQKWLMRLGNRVLTVVTNVLYGSDLRDMETCYKLISKEIIDQIDLHARGFDIEAEVTAKILKRGHRIHQVPIWYSPRTEKKLTPLDGLPTLWTLIKLRFTD